MKKMSWLIFITLPFLAMSQQQGIHFEHGLSWRQIKEKAKVENKYIFMDCYATWCGPCKAMATSVFPQKEAGDFFNDKFINVKVQMDSTEKDNDEVKAWYDASRHIADDYAVAAFPTFLFFSPSGEIVHKVVGASKTAGEFNMLAADALDSTAQYFTLMKKYKQGNRDLDFLKIATMAAYKASDKESGTIISNAFFDAQKGALSKDDIKFVSMFVQSSKSRAFSLFLNNGPHIDSLMGKGMADKVVMPVIAEEELYQKIKMDGPDPNWDLIKLGIIKKYPNKSNQINELIAGSKIGYYQNKNAWDSYAAAATDYMKVYGNTASAIQLNDMAWHVFTSVKETDYLNNALEWSRLSLRDDSGNGAFMDTYANLLYKLGKKNEAIQYEQKALSLVPEADKPNYVQTLEKMKSGQKTWD